MATIEELYRTGTRAHMILNLQRPQLSFLIIVHIINAHMHIEHTVMNNALSHSAGGGPVELASAVLVTSLPQCSDTMLCGRAAALLLLS